MDLIAVTVQADAPTQFAEYGVLCWNSAGRKAPMPRQHHCVALNNFQEGGQ
jgi:hypothetical protein